VAGFLAPKESGMDGGTQVFEGYVDIADTWDGLIEQDIGG